MPFVAASLSQRVFAGAVDLGITGVSVALFAAIAYKLLDHPAMGKLLVLGLLVSAVVLWSAYQYLFTVYAGRTMGMMAAHLRLVTFAGKSAGVRVRRNRVLGFYLSALSLGMGLMWSLVDVDHLCWHDRLSSSFLSSNN